MTQKKSEKQTFRAAKSSRELLHDNLRSGGFFFVVVVVSFRRTLAVLIKFSSSETKHSIDGFRLPILTYPPLGIIPLFRLHCIQ